MCEMMKRTRTGSSVEIFLIEKLAPAVLEFTNRRRAERARFAVREIWDNSCSSSMRTFITALF
jgi:hypothetical protein